jgi:conjugal transfer pilus assembly protein TraA
VCRKQNRHNPGRSINVCFRNFNSKGILVKNALHTPTEPIAVRLVTALLLTAILFFFSQSAFAEGNTGGASEFQEIYETVKDWVTGYLGKLLALFAFLVGLFFGAIKQNFIMALGGVGIAIMVAVMPALLEKLIGAVI